MPMFQARIIRQEVAITDVEGDTLETAKEKLRVWLENDDNLRSLDWLTHSAGSAPEIVVMMEISPARRRSIDDLGGAPELGAGWLSDRGQSNLADDEEE